MLNDCPRSTPVAYGSFVMAQRSPLGRGSGSRRFESYAGGLRCVYPLPQHIGGCMHC